MLSKRLFVDMDGTLAKFKKVDELEELYEKGYFVKLMPQRNVVNAIREIVLIGRDLDVFILSAFLSDSSYALEEKNEWIEIDSAKYFFGEDGSKVTGLLEKDGDIYPLGDDGALKSMQWVDVDGNSYYTNEDGTAMAGWRVINGRKYYFVGSKYEKYSKRELQMKKTTLSKKKCKGVIKGEKRKIS